MNKHCEIAWEKFCKNNPIINKNDNSIIRSIFEYAFKEGYSVNNNFKVGDIVKVKIDAEKHHTGYQNGYCWLESRNKYLGKVTIITDILSDESIKLEISDNEDWYWSAIDLEHYN